MKYFKKYPSDHVLGSENPSTVDNRLLDAIKKNIGSWGTSVSPEDMVNIINNLPYTLTNKQALLFAKFYTDGDYRTPRGYSYTDVTAALDAYLYADPHPNLLSKKYKEWRRIFLGGGYQSKLAEMMTQYLQTLGYSASASYVDCRFGGGYEWVVDYRR